MRITVVFVLSALAASCGSQTESYVQQRVSDASPATDAPPAADAVPEDAVVVEDVAPADVSVSSWTPPDGTHPDCVSGTRWTRGNRGSASMNPGQACVACHVRDREAPGFAASGTAFYLDHEVNNCYGYTGAVPGGTGGAAYIELVDAHNQTVRLRINSAGNFYTQTALSFPLTTARIIGPTGLVNEMSSAVPHGDCNGCHTQQGTTTVTGGDPAPGRIVVPL